jgi:hypothetical protein
MQNSKINMSNNVISQALDFPLNPLPITVCQFNGCCDGPERKIWLCEMVAEIIQLQLLFHQKLLRNKLIAACFIHC